MKKLLICCLLTGLLSGSAQAQNKQIKVLLEQIAALHVYIDYAQQGYSTVKKGLDVIGDFKRGEFNLHTDYFNSLRKVNPAIKSYVRVAETITLQAKILERYRRTFDLMQQDDDLFHGDELDYIQRVYERLLKNCEGTLDELEAIITDGQLEMKDDERIERIDMLHANMMDNYTFCESFSANAKVFAVSRMKEQNDVQNGRILHGTNN